MYHIVKIQLYKVQIFAISLFFFLVLTTPMKLKLILVRTLLMLQSTFYSQTTKMFLLKTGADIMSNILIESFILYIIHVRMYVMKRCTFLTVSAIDKFALFLTNETNLLM